MIDIYTILSAIAVIVGTMWMITNFYQYYPIVQSKLLSLATQVSTNDTVFLAQDDSLDALTNKARRNTDNLKSIPTIDVFIPAYKEASILHQSIQSVRETTYPTDSLNIYLLLEPDDVATQERAAELATKYTFTKLIVPRDYPSPPNKPRALNYAFEHSNGDIVGIMDAENIVEPDLFDRVAAAMVQNDLDYLQGLVDMANESDGWLNLLFRAEYGFWYRIIVPAFQRLNFPIPLSGTTCFFRRELLEDVSELRYQRGTVPWGLSTAKHSTDSADTPAPRQHATDGGYTDSGSDYVTWFKENDLQGFVPWDPTNVTEDFELGLLLWAYDYDFGLVKSVTREESPRNASTWLKQRTRWQKGKLYTFLNFLRTPVESSHKQSHILWQSFLPHLGPLNIAALALLILIGFFIGFVPELPLVTGILSIGFAFLVISIVSYVAGYWIASTEPLETTFARSFIVLVTAPLYWVLQWIADIRAAKQLLSGNLSWEKTFHEDANKFEELHQVDVQSDRNLTKLLRSYIGGNRYLLPILLIAVLTRLPGLSRSLWLDEAYTVVVRSSQSVIGIVTTVEPHPPLYYLLAGGWMRLFGNSEIAIRSLSLLFGILVIIAAYLFASRLYNSEFGIYVAILFAMSTIQIQYSQTARMYIFEMLLAILSLHFYLRLLDTETLETKFAYGLSTVFLLYTHIYGGLILIAQLLHLATHVYRNNREGFASAISVLKVAAMTVLAFSPWVAGMLVPNFLLTEGQGAISWLHQPSPTMIRDILFSYVGTPINYPIRKFEGITINLSRLVIFAFIGASGYLFARVVLQTTISDFLELSNSSADSRGATQTPIFKSDTDGICLAFAILTSFIALPYIISQIMFPILTVRYAIIGYLGFALLTTRSIMVFSNRKTRVIILCLLVVLATPGLLGYYQTSSVEPWGSLAKSLDDDDLSDDLVIYNPKYTELPFSYYLDKQDKKEVTTIAYVNGSKIESQLETNSFDEIWIVTYIETANELHPLLSLNYRHTDEIKEGNLRLIKYTNQTNNSKVVPVQVDRDRNGHSEGEEIASRSVALWEDQSLTSGGNIESDEIIDMARVRDHNAGILAYNLNSGFLTSKY